MARFEVDALTNNLQAVRTQQLTEAWGDHVDPSGPYNDTPGFGWLSRRLGYFTQGSDRTEGRYAPVYDHELDLKAIRMAAWLMDEEVPVAKAMKNRLVDYTIGSGFDWEVTHPSPRVQAICRRIVSSFMDNSDWTTLERESFKREIVDGEFIAEFVADGPDISMEVREGDHLTEPANSYELEDWKGYTFETCWSFGILTRKGRAAPIAYHVNRDGVGQDWDLIDADRFVHWKRNAPRNAKRGFSDHYTTHKWLKYGADVLGRTAQGTAVQASIAYIVEHAKGTTPKQAQAIASGRNIVVEKDYQTGQYVNKRKIGAGEVIDIPEGAKYHAGLLGSNASMIYIDVMEALFRLSGVVYAFPEHFVTGYAGNNNRASAEEASSPFIQGRFADQGVRKQQMRRLLLNVIKFGLERLPRLGIVYEEIEHELNVSIAEPEIVTKDPAALTSALKMQKEAGWISDRMAIQELGRDYEDVMQQREEEAGTQPGQQPDSPTDQSMAGLSRRQFMNNKKAILDIVRELKGGEIDEGQATVMLAALGLSKGLVDQLLGKDQLVEMLLEAWDPAKHPNDPDGKYTHGGNAKRAGIPQKDVNDAERGDNELSPSESAALDYYKASGFYTINQSLRKGDKSNVKTQETISRLDSAIGKSKLAENTTLYRILDGKRVGDKYLKPPGTVVKDKGFISTSSSLNSAQRAVSDLNYGTTTTLEIRAQAGTNALDMEARGNVKAMIKPLSNESEFLLPRGTELRIISIDHDNRYVIAEFVASTLRESFLPNDFLQEARDADGDGLVFDGTKHGRAVTPALTEEASDDDATKTLQYLTDAWRSYP